MMKILVVVDMQNDFVDGPLGSNEAIAIVDNVVKKINEFDGDLIIVTYDSHSDNYNETREGRYLPVPHCIMGTDGWKLNDKVQKALDSKKYLVIHKSAFGTMGIVELLGECDQVNTEITLIGLCTDICVISNAIILLTNYPQMNINVDASCCAGVTPESHKAALLTMKMCQINVIGE